MWTLLNTITSIKFEQQKENDILVGKQLPFLNVFCFICVWIITYFGHQRINYNK